MNRIFFILMSFLSSSRVELEFLGFMIKIGFNIKSQGAKKLSFSPQGSTSFKTWEMKLWLLLIMNV